MHPIFSTIRYWPLCLLCLSILRADDAQTAVAKLTVSGSFSYDGCVKPPAKGSPADREANGYLRAIPDCRIIPHHPNAVAVLDMHPGDFFRRLEFIPDPDGDYALVRVIKTAQAAEECSLTVLPVGEGKSSAFYAQTLSLPPGMAARIVEAMRREVAAAKPGGEKGNCRKEIGEDGYVYYGLLDGHSSIFLFAVRAPDGSYKFAEACLPRAYNPARLAAVFNLLKTLPLPPEAADGAFLQIDALLTLLESGQNAP